MGEDGAVGALGPLPGVAGPRYGDGARADTGGQAERLLLQCRAQQVGRRLVAVPDPGEPRGRPGAAALALQPDRAPVGEPVHHQLPRCRGHQVLVELAREQVGRLGQEGERPAPGQIAVPPVVLRRGEGTHRAGPGGRLPGRPGGGGQVLPDVRGQPGPDGLEAGAVGDAPGLGEGGDELEPPAVLGGIGAPLRVVAHRARGVVVGDLQDQRGGLGPGRALQAEQQLHGRTGVHDGVGDQFVGDGHGVVGEPVAEPPGAGQSERSPLGEGGPDEPAARGGGQRNAGQARTGDGTGVVALTGDDASGTVDDVPLQGNGPHGAAPDGLAIRR